MILFLSLFSSELPKRRHKNCLFILCFRVRSGKKKPCCNLKTHEAALKVFVDEFVRFYAFVRTFKKSCVKCARRHKKCLLVSRFVSLFSRALRKSGIKSVLILCFRGRSRKKNAGLDSKRARQQKSVC